MHIISMWTQDRMFKLSSQVYVKKFPYRGPKHPPIRNNLRQES